jgi:hypothetical protein
MFDAPGKASCGANRRGFPPIRDPRYKSALCETGRSVLAGGLDA